MHKRKEDRSGGVSRSTRSPPYATSPIFFHKIKLESSSTGSSFPAIYTTPVPVAEGSLGCKLGQWKSR